MSFDLPVSTTDLGTTTRDPAPPAPRFPAVCAALVALLAAGACLAAFLSDGRTSTVVYGAVGYVSGALVATALWSVQRAADSRARQHPEFRPRPVWGQVSTVALWLGVCTGIGSAFALATELAKW
ncbi:hypothetical protein ATJ88_3530 [Isoptericola jiangsuensis]|uniref:Uncharacterized protein n=1 Tax=Isoptericola jiangsuensis TaxID=548579 RepID=A0A2A9F1B4_9MICO|nr:hypothetical protein [Isoptericola jiangsuensis]PFG44793.1 hypothetical protein ATJ88_3530 [Isoptericola jiangsuensis]